MMGWTYEDQARYFDFVRLSQEDVTQTIKKAQVERTHYEANPIVAPVVNNTDPATFRALSLVGLWMLGERWSGMDAGQRRIEMIIAQGIEAYALHFSGEPWKVTVFALDNII